MTATERRLTRESETQILQATPTVPRRRARVLLGLVLVMGAALIAIGAWVVWNQADGTGLPAEVEQAIDEFVRGMEEPDTEALRAVVTDDFREIVHYYEHGIGSQAGKLLAAGRSSNTIEGVVAGAIAAEWQIEQFGTPVVTGDGPWFVSVEEDWIKCGHRDSETGECTALVNFLGSALYTVVEEDGVYRIMDHLWAGLRAW